MLTRSVVRLTSLALALCCAAPAAAQPSGWAGRLVGPRGVRDLSHPEMEVRLAGVRRLGRWGERGRAVTALIEHLDAEEDPRVRGAVFEALRRRGDRRAVSAIAVHLADWGREDRSLAIEALGALGGDEAIRVLAEWLGAADVGEDAADALAVIGAPAVPRLLAALAAPVSQARAARALGHIGDARATPALVVALADAPPDATIAILDALAQLSDERAADAIAPLLEVPSPDVARAALRAIRQVGRPDHAPQVARCLSAEDATVAAAALATLVVLAPEDATPHVARVLTDPDAPALSRQVALDAIVEHPDDAFVPHLAELLDDPDLRATVAEALSRVPGGRGLDALLDRVEARSEPTLLVPLALGLRRHADTMAAGSRARALTLLRADTTDRGLVLRALAGDVSVVPELADRLDADDAGTRARVAQGLWLLGPRAASAAPIIADRIVVESDPTAFRALALAALRTDAEVDPARVDGRWWDPETAPEALWLTAENLDIAATRTRARARRALRRALRAPEARVRAGAALALGAARERSAWRALAATLEDEHDRVRLAAARALASLVVADAVPALAARYRVERAPEVRAMLAEALATARGARPSGVFARGGEVLYARVVAAAGVNAQRADAERAPLHVDVYLSDARWLRIVTLDGGEVLAPDLRAGIAEVQVRLGSR